MDALSWIQGAADLVWEHVSAYYRLSKAYGIYVVERLGDFERCLSSDGVCFVLRLEGAEALDEPYDLVLLGKLGLRSVVLTWNYTNKYGAGCSSGRTPGSRLKERSSSGPRTDSGSSSIWLTLAR